MCVSAGRSGIAIPNINAGSTAFVDRRDDRNRSATNLAVLDIFLMLDAAVDQQLYLFAAAGTINFSCFNSVHCSTRQICGVTYVLVPFQNAALQ